MTNTNNDLNTILGRIEAFIELYYRNLIIKGAIFSVALLVLFFLLISIVEYFNYFGSLTRTLLFFGYIFAAVIIVAVYMIWPALKLVKIGKRLSAEQAADIISKHFPEMGDKLINTLQLGDMLDDANNDFVKAAIEQKILKISHIPFTGAIDKKENVRRIPYALVPVSIVLIILLASPKFIVEPSERLSNFNKHYEKPMPFQFLINNDDFNVLKGEDLHLGIQIKGNKLPKMVEVVYNGKSARASKISASEFAYRFRNLNEDINFSLAGGGFNSKQYRISVLPKPLIMSFHVELDYPDYINKTSEISQNTGDLTVPEGTEIRWKILTETTDRIFFNTSNNLDKIESRVNDNEFEVSLIALETFDYTIKSSNEFTVSKDSLLHQVTVVPDLYPEIRVETIIDSSNYQLRFFNGEIKDDYGFNKLEFVFTKEGKASHAESTTKARHRIPIEKERNQQSFFYSFDFNDYEILPGDRISYWFEVWDNDEINGSKSSRTSVGYVEVPGRREQENLISDQQDEMITEMDQLQQSLKELSREIEQLQKSILSKESMSWEDSNKMQEMLEQQLNLQNRVDQLKTDHKALNRKQKEINPYNEEIIRKQEELQKLFDDIMTDEMKALFEELQKLVDELDRGKMQEMLEKMEMSNEEMMKNMDRSLELFKQLEMEKMITETMAKLEKLAEEQDELAGKTKEGESDSEELGKDQEKIADDFEEIKESLEKMQEKNEELQRQYEMIDTDSMEREIEQSINESLENLKMDSKPGSLPHQDDAAKNMRNMSESLMDMMMQMQSEQLAEDARMLRKLLEDLIDISFDQEDLIETTAAINRIDPRYNEILSEQKRLIVNLKQVEDSLNALAKRQIAIQQFVLREIADINNNVEKALETLEERNVRSATSRQQFVMTSVNNLALMLSEALEEMDQQMMSSNMDGSSCPASGQKPGQGKPSMGNMKSLQQQLNQQLQQMKQSKGTPGEGENGMPQQGGQSMSEQFARMAAQQEALRRQMQQYLEELKSATGKSDGNAMKAIEEMEQTEKDLVNKRISNETIMRQERIMTRLLESEKAEMEREKEERRESEQAGVYPVNDPDSVIEIYRKRMNEQEMLRTIPPQLNSFYRSKVNNYFLQVQ
jgi:hypothetical protein